VLASHRQVAAQLQLLVDAASPRDFTPRMKTVFRFTAALLVLGSPGCIFGRHKQQPPPPAVVDLTGSSAAPATTNTFLVTPDLSTTGQIASVNKNLRFVVVTFLNGQVPAVGARMNIYRRGEIVGEIKISDPQRDNNSAADIVFGDAQKGDEVRQK
jgi:hypothetical protein